MLKKIACVGLIALGLVATMSDEAEARFRRNRGCSSCNPTPCNSCVPQGQMMDPNAPMLNPNGPGPMNAPAQPPQPPAPAPQPTRSGTAA